MTTISEYDEAERRAIVRSVYPAIRAFRPAAFTLASFPTRISHESELTRYSDIMNELSDRTLFYEKLYSIDEIKLMQAVSSIVGSITRRLGREVHPFMAMLPPISVLRAIQSLTSGPLSVLEIGPGSGYLGAYLLKSIMPASSRLLVHRYCAVDNTQALYLWQSIFFSALDPDFSDYATAEAAPHVISSRVSVLPWWHFASMYKHRTEFDVVVCDAALGEMDPFAANYVIRLASKVLKSSAIGAFLFRHIGEQRLNSMDYIESRFKSSGFIKQIIGDVTAFSLRPLPTFSSGCKYTKKACDHLPVDKKLESYEFFDFIGLHRS